MTRKIKLTRANKSILLKALAPYYYQEKALGHNTENPGRLILKIDSLPADKKSYFFYRRNPPHANHYKQAEERASRKRQYTDAADDMLTKIILENKLPPKPQTEWHT